MKKQFVSVEAAHFKLCCISDSKPRVPQQKQESSEALCIAFAGARAVRLKGRNDPSHFFPRKGHSGFVRHLGSLQVNCWIFGNPFSLFSKPHECPQAFQLLEARARPLCPRRTKRCQRVEVQLCEELQLVCFCEGVKLLE